MFKNVKHTTRHFVPLATIAFLSSAGIASAEEQDDQIQEKVAQINEVDARISKLQTQLGWLPKEAKTQKTNIQNQILSQKQVKELLEQQKQDREDEIANTTNKEEEQETEQPQPKEQVATEPKEQVKTQVNTQSTNVVYNPAGNTYPYGQCTWGVKSVAPWVGNYWGNAGQWAASAASQGFRVDSTPTVGSVIVFPYGGGGFGHVGYVTDVNPNGSIKIVECNVNGNTTIQDYRGWFTPRGVSYIHPK